MKIAITGHNGFLGTHFLKKIPKKFDVVLFDEKKQSLFVVSSLKSFVQADVIIHLAGANRDTDSNLIKVNVYGTSVLLEAMKTYNPEARIIFASTYQVYYENSLYGLSKKMAEELIESLSKTTKIKGTVLRISNIYGAGGKPFYNSVIATFTHLVRQGKPLMITGNGNSKRDYIFVEDVVTAIVQLIFYKQKKLFEIFDVGSGKASSLKKIVSILKRQSSKSFDVVYNKTNQTDPGLILRNINKTKKELKWSPKYSMEQGLTKILHETEY